MNDEERQAFRERAKARAEATANGELSRQCRRDNRGKASGRGKRIRSIRGYRARLDELYRRLIAGEIGIQAYRAAVQGTQAASELMLSELELNAAGLQDVEPGEHALGDAGGYEGDEKAKAHKRKKIRASSGTDKNGEPREERTIEVETEADDDDATADVGVELLR